MEIIKRLGAVAPSATTNTELYSTTASTKALIGTINVCNRSASPVTFRIAHVDALSDTPANEDYIAYDVGLAANSFVPIQCAITMDNSHRLVVYASSGDLSFIAWGVEHT